MIAFSGIVRRTPPGVNLFFMSYSVRNARPAGPALFHERATAAGLILAKPAAMMSSRSSRVSV